MDKLSRRDFIFNASGAISVACISANTIFFNPLETFTGDPEKDLIWDKAPCRFCGTGCSVLVGVKDGKIIAVKGDPESSVNQGTLCIKGYSLPFIQYSRDRLTKPLIRKKNGHYDKNGEFTGSTWEEALSLIAQKAKATIKEKGPEGVAMFGSGQWTIWEGYAASKIWKAGLKSNSLEVNARHCMASAVSGFMTTFGIDEPMGTYDDIDHADVFVLWGANMAEMHPILFSKITDRLLTSPGSRLYNLTVFSNRSSSLAEKEIIFKPQSDLAIANGIANLLIQNGQVNQSFVKKHIVFKKGLENIGYGLEDKFEFNDKPVLSDYEAYKQYVARYTPEFVEKISGISPADLKILADVYGDPKLKVMSFWSMGMNQHTRGTWINNLVYNLHLLSGKICESGNQPFSLTGQPSACGTCREVGTFTHRLPADMVVTDPEHRARCEKIWKIPEGTIPAKPTYHAVEMLRAVDRGDVTFFWSMVANPFQGYANLNRYREAAQKKGRFIVISDVYPGRSTEIADVVLPSAMWVEKEGSFGNGERRTHFWKKMVDSPGDSKSDLWQLLQFAKHLGIGHLFQYSPKDFPLPIYPSSDITSEEGYYVEKALWEEYRLFGLGHGHDLAPFDVYHACNGLRWPVVNGKETMIRFREGTDPYVEAGKGLQFYGNHKQDNKATVWMRPYEPAAEEPDKAFPFWLCTGRVLEHWHSGTMTQRIPALHKAYPHAIANLNSVDGEKLGVQTGDKIRIESRRGFVDVYAEIGGRVTPQEGMVFVPWFDENVLINNVTLDAFCPISRQTDYKKCAVRLQKLT